MICKKHKSTVGEYVADDATIKIAIVEDEIEMVNVLKKKLFVIRGIPISFIACDGKEAVDMFQASSPKPDIILLDNRIPTKNGIAVAKEIKSMDPDVKIIFLSADSRVEKAAIASGANVFLKKPSTLKAILKAIELASSNPARQVIDA